MGAENGPQRPLSSPTTSGLVTTTREEPQLPPLVPVTITAIMSREAQTQQPAPAPTKPHTTGNGAGSGGPSGLTSRNKKDIARKLFWNGKIVQCKKHIVSSIGMTQRKVYLSTRLP